MKRDLPDLANRKFDLLVIGGGIYGAFVAWDAALRGLSVALVEKGDFGGATSANSLKIIHGGLRYLRDRNLRLVRTMVSERSTWMRIAPHLVHPLPCLLPTDRQLASGKLAMSLALTVNNMLSYDRNIGTDPQKHLPDSRIISKQACLRALPGFDPAGITGGALWHDAQVLNSERLLLSIIKSAAESGAVVANYTEVTGFVQTGDVVSGAIVRDLLSGDEFEIQSEIAVNCAGAWVDEVLGLLDHHAPAPTFYRSLAVNLVTRQILPDLAVGVSSSQSGRKKHDSKRRRSQVLFIVPWREFSLIGTLHSQLTASRAAPPITEATVQDFVERVNEAYPAVALARDDVYHVHSGFLPMRNSSFTSAKIKLVREGSVQDHARRDKIHGLLTVIGVKYTTARHVAANAVDLAVAKLDRRAGPCRTHNTPVFGGKINQFDKFLEEAVSQRPEGLPRELAERLASNHGSAYYDMLRYVEVDPALGQPVCAGYPVIRAEVIHAMRHEMAQTLADVVQRRTELGAAGLPREACVVACADLMANELGWDRVYRQKEIDNLIAAYPWTKNPAVIG